MVWIVVWIVAAVGKVGYMVYYNKRADKKWKVWDSIIAIVINVVFYGMIVEMLLKVIG